MNPAGQGNWLRGRLRGVAVDVTPLRDNRDFRLLYIGQGVSFVGTMVTFVAVPFQVFELTGSVLLVGLLGVAELVPLLVMAFLGGALADAFERRWLILAAEAALAITVALLMLNSLQPEPSVAALFVLAAIASGLSGLRRPPLEAITQQLVPRDQMAAAAGLNSLRGTAGMIGGPALGGVLIAAFGLSWTYAFDVVTFAASLVCLALMAKVPLPGGGERPSLQGVVDGLRYAVSRQELIGTYVVDFVAMVFGMPIALFPAIAQGLGGPGVLGLLYAAPGVGAFLASLTSGWTARVHRHGWAIIWAAVGWGAAITVFGVLASGLVTEAWLALIFLALAGGSDMISGLFRLVIWNQTIPESLRGRMASIEQISYTSGPLLGNAEAGLVAGLFGVPVSVISGGVLCILGTGICAWLLPRFREYDNRSNAHALAAEGTSASRA